MSTFDIGGTLGDDHAVGVEHAARLRHDELDIRVVVQPDLGDVAAPGHGDGQVAACQGVVVVVAVEGPELAPVGSFQQLGLGGLDILDGGLLRHHAQRQQGQAHGVAHLGEHAHATGELGIEEVVEAADLATREGGVVGDAYDAADVGDGVAGARVVPDIAVDGLDVGLEVRQQALVQLLEVAQADQALDHPVGRRDDVVAGRIAGREVGLDAAEELLVVVDVLPVGDGGAGLRGELLERRVGACLLVDVDVQGPVGEDDLAGTVGSGRADGRRQPGHGHHQTGGQGHAGHPGSGRGGGSELPGRIDAHDGPRCSSALTPLSSGPAGMTKVCCGCQLSATG